MGSNNRAKERHMRSTSSLATFLTWRNLAIVMSCLGIAAVGTPGTLFAAPKFFTCSPIEARAFPGKRVGVRCSPGDGQTIYFALAVGDDGDANRVLSLISTALVTKRKLSIQ